MIIDDDMFNCRRQVTWDHLHNKELLMLKTLINQAYFSPRSSRISFMSACLYHSGDISFLSTHIRY